MIMMGTRSSRIVCCATCLHRLGDFKLSARRLLVFGRGASSSSSLTEQEGRDAKSNFGGNGVPFRPKRALVVSKLSRYAFEKKRFGDIGEDGLKKVLSQRGSHYDKLLKKHRIHESNVRKVVDTFESQNIEVRLAQRFDHSLNHEAVRWADVVVPAGGDGTFIMAASKVMDDKPILGVNTDPSQSAGYLCLPERYTLRFDDALRKIAEGRFRWKWRQRIRTTVESGLINAEPIDLHEQQLKLPDHQVEHWTKEQRLRQGLEERVEPGPRVLPVRALNEVFIGESLSSTVSYYEISVDGSPMVKQKSSGITICTGTGSTSWSFNINKLSHQSVRELLNIINNETDANIPANQDLQERIASRFNSSLVFDASRPTLAYTVRDPVINGIFNAHMPRGFAKKIRIRSRGWDACLVMDSGSSFVFNDGAIATLEIKEEDALRTFDLLD
ncbi:NAD kinase 2, mitochondrial-like [Acanthaster planci]|uniref:NAD kinase 2, mitochondrial n=1 Tax=Acanthaster planci TaxID=133434 RepID=A0A8B7ZWC9_ACAPL|nr:NAD kinase 2, mitochondrial-like [Acanthaster planci]